MASLTIKLNTGADMPALGLGTWKSSEGEVAAALEYAIVEVGMRHIDGAYIYANEAAVGEGIRRALATGKVTREELFITTKVWPTYHNRVEQSLNASLKALGLDYVDLLLVHWPFGFHDDGTDNFFPKKADGTMDVDESFSFANNWAQFEAVYTTGKTKAIGVSNFSIVNLEKLLKTAKVIPALNQIEGHPLLPQVKLCEYCKKHGIVVEAWRPLGSSSSILLENKDILRIAEKHNSSAGSVLISWHLMEGRAVVPKSTNPKRIKSNAVLVKLDADDLETIDNLHKTLGIKRFGAGEFANGLVHFDDWD